jgi:hypothetical protein
MMPVVSKTSWPGALAPVPDLPTWVEARSLALNGRGRIVAQEPARDAWIALALDASVGVVVGHPSPGALARAVAAGRARTTWLWPDADAPRGGDQVQDLPGLHARADIRMTLPAQRLARVRPDEAADVRWLMSAATTDLSMTDADERRAVTEALTVTPVAASFDHGVPVSFCYASHETDAWWRVAALTVQAARRRGHARAVTTFVVDHYRGQSKAPVCLSREDEGPSRALALALGFVTTETVRVFARA